MRTEYTATFTADKIARLENDLKITQSRISKAGQRNGEMQGTIASLQGERDHYKAHTEKLAEACMIACQFLSSAVVDWKTQQAIADKLRKALAAYESEVRQ